MEERRLILALALSLLVVATYNLLFQPARPPKAAPSPSSSAAATPAASPTPSPRTTPRPRWAPKAPVTPTVADARERRVEVLSEDLTVAFTNKGARLLSWRLSRFTDARGRPEEMVPGTPGGSRPLDIETGDPALDTQLREALFRPSAETLTVPASGRAQLRFEFSEGELSAAKTIEFSGRGYLVSVAVSVRKAGQEVAKRVLLGPGIGNPSSAETGVQGYQAPQAVAFADDGVHRVPPDKLANARSFSSVRWAGVDSHYFTALIVPPGGQGVAQLRAVTLAPPLEDAKPLPAPVAVLELGPTSDPALLYMGPKDYHAMAQLGHGLARVVDVGDWIGPIVVPFMDLLRWVHGFVGNYGLSIVVLTIVINLAMAPLRHYSIANGLKMQKMGPEMKVIQERYRKVPLMDPKRQQMQEEMATLYARHGMNMGTQMTVGCLPILLTMPFLIAFYRVLQVSIELRGASFLWIPDLSHKDPYFITPILMGLSMFLMTRMTPSTLDPTQRRMMLLMPLMLMWMFLWAPAGLNLYWLASNVCSIVQQGVTLSLLQRQEGAKERSRK